MDLNDSVDNSTRDPYNCIRGRRHPSCNSQAVPIPPRLSVVGSNTYQGAAFSGDRKEIIDKVLEGSDAFAASGMQTYSQQRICSSESRLTTIVDVKQMSMKALESEVEDMVSICRTFCGMQNILTELKNKLMSWALSDSLRFIFTHSD